MVRVRGQRALDERTRARQVTEDELGLRYVGETPHLGRLALHAPIY